MFFLNLSLPEFLTLLGSLSGIVAALYLLDRAKRKKLVSSLRFWVAAPRVDEQQRRKRIREPWSLILQLASLLLLLLAIAQLQWGSRSRVGRNHVIVLDTSSWMAQRSGEGTLLDDGKQKARAYARSVPPHDRVMLIRADGIATPAISFTENRKQLIRAINESTPSYTALNLSSALNLAYHALKWSNAGTGEVVFIGGKRVANWDDENASVPGLRELTATEQTDDAGIRRVSVRRDPDTNDLWLASVAVQNYSGKPRTVHVALRFGASDFAARALNLDAGEERTAEYKFTTTGPGTLTASIDARDDLALDNRVQLEIPPAGRLRVTVYSNRPLAWQPLLEADSHLQTTYLPPSLYSAVPPAEVVILDGFSPVKAPRVPSIWVSPDRDSSPVPVASIQSDVVLNRWNADTPLGAGLRSKEARLAQAEVFDASSPDVAIATSDRGPVVVARPARGNSPRLAEIGFDPLSGPLRYTVSTPLLFANLFHWLEPESLRTTELTAAAVGSASVVLDANEWKQRFRVVDERGLRVPFTIRGGVLQLYASKPSIVRVISPERERVLSLTLPGIGEFQWKPPVAAPHSLPQVEWPGRSAVDLWKWLATLGGLGLFIEWLFFGKLRPLRWRPAPVLRERASSKGNELVHR